MTIGAFHGSLAKRSMELFSVGVIGYTEDVNRQTPFTMKMTPENLQSLISCAVCNKKYQPAKMLVLDEDEKRTTLHLSCGACNASSIVFVSTGQFGVVSLGMLTDLEQGEAKRVFRGEPISTDQVLEVHQFLKRYRGGVDELI